MALIQLRILTKADYNIGTLNTSWDAEKHKLLLKWKAAYGNKISTHFGEEDRHLNEQLTYATTVNLSAITLPIFKLQDTHLNKPVRRQARLKAWKKLACTYIQPL